MSEPVIPERWRSHYERLLEDQCTGECVEMKLMNELGAAEAALSEAQGNHYDALQEIASVKSERDHYEELLAKSEQQVTQQAATIQRLENHEIALHFTAFAIARERILHMAGPLEVNEVLTEMDEACELAEMSPSLVDAQDKRISEQAATIRAMAALLVDIGKYLKASGTRFSFAENGFYERINTTLANLPTGEPK